jgi:RNA polymerase sigma factor (sigma-70 family)
MANTDFLYEQRRKKAIGEICEKPGILWAEEEYKLVLESEIWPHYKLLLNFAKYHLGRWAREEDAEDALQEFILKQLFSIVSNYDPERGNSFLKYFLFCFGRFCAKKRPSLQKELNLIPLEEVEPTIKSPEETSDKEDKDEISECVELLPHRYQVVIRLHFVEGRSHSEIAKLMAITEGNARVILYRGLQKLAQLYRQRNNPYEKTGNKVGPRAAE